MITFLTTFFHSSVVYNVHMVHGRSLNRISVEPFVVIHDFYGNVVQLSGQLFIGNGN